MSKSISPTTKQALVDDMVQLINLVNDIESLPSEGDSDERVARTTNLMVPSLLPTRYTANTFLSNSTICNTCESVMATCGRFIDWPNST